MTRREKTARTAVVAVVTITPLFLLLAFKGKSKPAAEAGILNTAENSAQIDPQKLIFLLQYVGKDYSEAVEGGQVVDEFEYHEMLEFVEASVAGYSCLAEGRQDPSILRQIQKLEESVRNKSDFSYIKNQTKEIISLLSDQLKVKTFPPRTPHLARGKSLFKDNCAVCHGPDGNGRGPAAADLNPKPTDFRNPGYSNEATPYLFYNAITFGVHGTAMPSYEQAFSKEDSWSVAFYLLTLRRDFLPRSEPVDLDISIEDLANKSNIDLIHRLEEQNSESTATHGDARLSHGVDYLRQNPPAGTAELH